MRQLAPKPGPNRLNSTEALAMASIPRISCIVRVSYAPTLTVEQVPSSGFGSLSSSPVQRSPHSMNSISPTSSTSKLRILHLRGAFVLKAPAPQRYRRVWAPRGITFLAKCSASCEDMHKGLSMQMTAGVQGSHVWHKKILMVNVTPWTPSSLQVDFCASAAQAPGSRWLWWL